MGDAKRRKSFDSIYGKDLRVTSSVVHVLGAPDELLTGKYSNFKTCLYDTKFDCMKPSVVRRVIAESKRASLSRYVLFDEVEGGSIVIPINVAKSFVADSIAKKYLHPCASQELAAILTQEESPRKIKCLTVVHDTMPDVPIFLDFMKSVGTKMFLFLTIHKLSDI